MSTPNKATPAEANLVGMYEASRRLKEFGISVALPTLYKWRDRHPDFPAPLRLANGNELTIGGGPVRRFDEILEWCRDTGRLDRK